MMSRPVRFLTGEAPADSKSLPPESKKYLIPFYIVCFVGVTLLLIRVIRHCIEQRRNPSSTENSSREEEGEVQIQVQVMVDEGEGVKNDIIESLPTFSYNSGLRECTICIMQFQEGDQIRLLPQCGHGFHVPCIDSWLRLHSSCPSCRQVLVEPKCSKCSQIPAGSSQV